MMEALDFFMWCEETWLGSSIRQSLWLFPVIEAFHLVAFSVMGGIVLMINFRLLGLVLRQRSVRELAEHTRAWFNGALVVMVTTGILLFLSESVKCYYNRPFWIKMICLGLALIFTYTVQRKVVATDEERLGPIWGRLAGVISIVLWGGVAWGGRWIGFWG